MLASHHDPGRGKPSCPPSGNGGGQLLPDALSSSRASGCHVQSNKVSLGGSAAPCGPALHSQVRSDTNYAPLLSFHSDPGQGKPLCSLTCFSGDQLLVDASPPSEVSGLCQVRSSPQVGFGDSAPLYGPAFRSYVRDDADPQPFLGSHVEPPCTSDRVSHVCDDDNAECKPSLVSGLNSGVLSPSNDPLGKPCAHARKNRAFDKAQETRSFDKATDESSGYKMTCSDCNAECTVNFSPPISPESAEKPPVASSSSAGVLNPLPVGCSSFPAPLGADGAPTTSPTPADDDEPFPVGCMPRTCKSSVPPPFTVDNEALHQLRTPPVSFWNQGKVMPHSGIKLESPLLDKCHFSSETRPDTPCDLCDHASIPDSTRPSIAPCEISDLKNPISILSTLDCEEEKAVPVVPVTSSPCDVKMTHDVSPTCSVPSELATESRDRRPLSAQCHAILSSSLEISFLGDSILQDEVYSYVAPSTSAESSDCDDICPSSENENLCTKEVNDPSDAFIPDNVLRDDVTYTSHPSESHAKVCESYWDKVSIFSTVCSLSDSAFYMTLLATMLLCLLFSANIGSFDITSSPDNTSSTYLVESNQMNSFAPRNDYSISYFARLHNDLFETFAFSYRIDWHFLYLVVLNILFISRQEDYCTMTEFLLHRFDSGDTGSSYSFLSAGQGEFRAICSAHNAPYSSPELTFDTEFIYLYFFATVAIVGSFCYFILYFKTYIYRFTDFVCDVQGVYFGFSSGGSLFDGFICFRSISSCTGDGKIKPLLCHALKTPGLIMWRSTMLNRMLLIRSSQQEAIVSRWIRRAQHIALPYLFIPDASIILAFSACCAITRAR